MSEAESRPRCFIAMPITTHEAHVDRYAGDEDHWTHVMETIFVPAVRRAGFEAIRPVASGSHMIHALIIEHLSTADLVLCDLSSHNPNVFFELGVRTSLNRPIALVKDEHLDIPFDTSGLNTHKYSSALFGWEVEEEVQKLADHLAASVTSCAGQNPLWRQFGLNIAARDPDPTESASEARLELIYDGVQELRREVDELRAREVRSDRSSMPSPGADVLTGRVAKMLGLSHWGITHGEGGRLTMTFNLPPANKLGAKELEHVAAVAKRDQYELARSGISSNGEGSLTFTRSDVNLDN